MKHFDDWVLKFWLFVMTFLLSWFLTPSPTKKGPPKHETPTHIR